MKRTALVAVMVCSVAEVGVRGYTWAIIGPTCSGLIARPHRGVGATPGAPVRRLARHLLFRAGMLTTRSLDVGRAAGSIRPLAPSDIPALSQFFESAQFEDFSSLQVPRAHPVDRRVRLILRRTALQLR